MLKLLISTLLFSFIFSIIKIPFKTKENPIKQGLTYVDSRVRNYEMGEIFIGEPSQKIRLIIATSYYHFIIANSKEKIDEIYSNISSSTSSLISNEKKIYYYNNYKGGFLAQDNFMFYNEKDKKKSYVNIPFLINDYDDEISGLLGLNLLKERNDEDLNFVKVLLEKKVIASSIWTIKYLNDNEGELIIGDYPHKYNNNYDENFLKFTKVEINYNKDWKIQFDEIKFDNDIQSSSISKFGIFVIENGLIKGPSEYEILFLQKLNKTNNCFELKREFSLVYYYCNKNTDIKLLPIITFYHRELNFTFNLTYEDLFIEKNGKYYLLMSFNKNHRLNEWTLGRIFMKKYEMIFDPENKLIGFYNDYKGKSFNISFTILIIFIIIIIGLIVIVNHIMKLKRRKTRANEIDEVYDYVPANQEILGIKDI